MAERAALHFAPVSRENRSDFEQLFEAPGGPSYCWCMVWRITKEEGRDTPGKKRKPFMSRRIDEGIPVGLLGYLGKVPRAWVSIAPRETYQRLGGPAAGPGDVIWSLACMYIHKSLRGRGYAHDLIEAAIDYAKKNKASLVEAYPVLPDSPSYRFMGQIPAFERLGFTYVEMAGTRRHVMRLPLAAGKR